MQLSQGFFSLALVIPALASVSMTTPLAAPSEDEAATVAAGELATYLVSHEQIIRWIASTDAELTFIGKAKNPLVLHSAQITMVVYCSTRADDVCGGPCTVYNGEATCLTAPDTNCIAATKNVGFCDRSGCGPRCNQLSTCGTRMDNGFCYTPDTQSTLVSAA